MSRDAVGRLGSSGYIKVVPPKTTIKQDFETVRVQLMKAEWPHGGHGTLDFALAALSRISDEDLVLRAALMEAREERDALKADLQAAKAHDSLAPWVRVLNERDALRAALGKLRTAAQVFHDSHAFIPQDEGDSHWCRLCDALKELEAS